MYDYLLKYAKEADKDIIQNTNQNLLRTKETIEKLLKDLNE